MMKGQKVLPNHFPQIKDNSSDTIMHAIKSEEDEAEMQSSRHKQNFIAIISNNPSNDMKSLTYIPILFGYIFVAFVPSLIYSWIPIHNVFEDPKYWYELPCQMTVAVICLIDNTILWASFYINMKFLKTYHILLKMIVVGLVVFLFLEIIGHIIWTQLMHYQHPIPFNGYIYIYLISPALYATLWYQFPSSWRRNKTFMKRLRAMITALALNHFLPIFYYIIIYSMFVCDPKYQWIVALATPVLREFNIWISFSYAKRATKGDTNSAEIVCGQRMCCGHAYIMVCTLGAIATHETSAVVLCIDFCINIFICCKIIFCKRNQPMDTDKQIGLLQELVINEIVEFMVPLAYLFVFIFAYYGPNAELIGTIKNGYWQYSPVEDIGYTIKCVMAFFLADLCSIFVSSLLLWNYCRINLYSAFVAIQKEFGIAFTVQLATIVNFVSILANLLIYSWPKKNLV